MLTAGRPADGSLLETELPVKGLRRGEERIQASRAERDGVTFVLNERRRPPKRESFEVKKKINTKKCKMRILGFRARL